MMMMIKVEELKIMLMMEEEEDGDDGDDKRLLQTWIRLEKFMCLWCYLFDELVEGINFLQ